MAELWTAGVIFSTNPSDGDILSFNVGTDTVTLTARATATGVLDFEIGDVDNGTNINCRDALIRDYNDIIAVKQAGSRAITIRALEYDAEITANPSNQIQMAYGSTEVTTSRLDFWFQQVGLPEDVLFQWDVDLVSGTSTTYNKTTKWTLQDPLLADEFYAGSSFQAAAQGLKTNLDTFNLGEGFAVTVETWTNKSVVTLSADEAGTQFSNISIGDVGATFHYTNTEAPPDPPTGERLFYEFSDEAGEDYTVSVYDTEYAGAPVEVVAGETPFEIEYTKSDIFDTLRGSGANLSFIYHGDEAFMREMFSSNLKRFPVTLSRYNESFPSNKEVIWTGFLNTELYEEDFSYDGQTIGVEYGLTANDGIGILKHIKLYNERSEDLTTFIDVIRGAIDKITFYGDAVPNTYSIFIDIDCQMNELYNPSILDDVLLNTSNFIDEDFVYKDAAFCLDAVLLPLRMSFLKMGNDFYIFPLPTKAEAVSFLARRLTNTGSGWVENGTATINLTPIQVELGSYFKTGQTMEYNTAISNQRITVDTYSQRDIFKNQISNFEKFSDLISSDALVGDETEFKWTRELYASHEDFTFSSIGNSTAYPTVAITDFEHLVDPEVRQPMVMVENPYLFPPNHAGRIDGFQGTGYGIIMTSKKLLPRTVSSNGGKLLLDMNVLVQWHMDEYLNTSNNHTTPGFEIGCMLNVGEYYLRATHIVYEQNNGKEWYGTHLYWTKTPTTFPVSISKGLNEKIEGQEKDGKWHRIYNYGKRQLGYADKRELYSSLFEPLEIPLPPNMKPYDSINSNLEPVEVIFGLSSYVAERWYGYASNYIAGAERWTNIPISRAFNPLTIDAFMVKDISLEFASDTSENTKVEFEVENDETYREKGSNIELNVGTVNSVDVLQRAAMYGLRLSDNYRIPLTTDIRIDFSGAHSDIYIIDRDGNDNTLEGQLINTLVANRFEPTVSISADLKWPMHTPLNILNFETFGNKNFEFIGGSIDVRENSIRGTWHEINVG